MSPDFSSLVHWILFLPLGAAALSALFLRRAGGLAAWLSTGVAFVIAGLSLILLGKGVDVTWHIELAKFGGVSLGFGYLLAQGNVEYIALHDADVLDYDRAFLARLLYPIADPILNFDFCKGYYARYTDRLKDARSETEMDDSVLVGEGRLEDILSALDTDGGDWAGKELATLRTKSPSACKNVLKQLATDEVNVSTVEDPIEMVDPALNQMQVQHGIDLGLGGHQRLLVGQSAGLQHFAQCPFAQRKALVQRAGHRLQLLQGLLGELPLAQAVLCLLLILHYSPLLLQAVTGYSFIDSLVFCFFSKAIKAMPQYWHKTSLQLMFALSSGIKKLQSLFNAVLYTAVITAFKMQEVKVLFRAPIAAIQGSF